MSLAETLEVTNLRDRVRAAARRGIMAQEAPRDTAADLLNNLWPVLSDDDIFDLALGGLAALLDDERSRLRRGTEFVEGDDGAVHEFPRETVDAVHVATGCYFTSHQKVYAKRAWCVGRLLRITDEDERERAIAEARAQNRGSEDREAELLGGFLGGVQRAVDEYVLAVFRGINLVGADGRSKTLDLFGMDDLDHWESRATATAKSWDARRDWFHDARKALAEHGKEAVGDLPSSVADGLADRAKDIWGGGSR